MKRVLIIANKSWEVEPALNAMLNSEFSTINGLCKPVEFPRSPGLQGQAVARAIWKNGNTQVEIWSIQDIMTPFVSKSPITDSQQYYSSSEQKYNDLKKIFETGEGPSLVIAFGTAGIPGELSYNGSVVIGSNIFIYNGHPNKKNPYSNLDVPGINVLLTSSVNDSFFDDVILNLSKVDTREKFTRCLLSTPLNPSSPTIVVNKDYLGLSNINVTDYTQYAVKDAEGLQALKSAKTGKKVISVETTHGLIRLNAKSTPFIFVSSLTDRVGHFESEVRPKDKAQNFTAAFNGGLALGWLCNLLLENPQLI